MFKLRKNWEKAIEKNCFISIVLLEIGTQYF